MNEPAGTRQDATMNMKTVFTTLCWLLVILLMAAGPLAAQEKPPADDPDAKCLKCHSKNLKKKLEDGETLSLKIAAEPFQQSVHRVIGCTGCHRDVAKGKHPSRAPISSRRDYSLRHNKTCGQCHEAMHDDYSGSIHASLVAEGNPNAPICSDCHSSHSIQPQVVYDSSTGEPCKKCHAEIYQAYAESVHGLAVTEGNVIRHASIRAPVCGDCHSVHDVTAVAASEFLVKACLNCHETAQSAHEQWLPNAGMHLSSVSCAACHSPLAERSVDLQLYDKNNDERLVGATGEADADTGAEERRGSDESLDAAGVRELVRANQSAGQKGNIGVRGRLEVTSGVDAHRLAPRLLAVRECESCHTQGAEGFQNVTVSLSTPGGQRQQFKTDEAVLGSAGSLRNLGDFYAPGGTRIRLLDWLLVLAIAGGLAVPIGHMMLGRILRSRKKTP